MNWKSVRPGIYNSVLSLQTLHHCTQSFKNVLNIFIFISLVFVSCTFLKKISEEYSLGPSGCWSQRFHFLLWWSGLHPYLGRGCSITSPSKLPTAFLMHVMMAFLSLLIFPGLPFLHTYIDAGIFNHDWRKLWLELHQFVLHDGCKYLSRHQSQIFWDLTWITV